MNDMSNTATETMQSFKDAADTGYSQLAAGAEAGKAKITEQMGKAMKKAEEAAAFGQGNIEAIMKSGQILTAGVQDLSKQFATSAQAQLDETMSTFKAMSSIRSLKDLLDMQTSFARASVEKAMSQTGRFTEASLKLAEEAMAPLTARVSLAVETFSHAA